MGKEYLKKSTQKNIKSGIDTLGLIYNTELDINLIKSSIGVIEKHTRLINLNEILIVLKASLRLNGGIELTDLNETLGACESLENELNLSKETRKISRIDFSVDLLETVKENKKKFLLFLECLDLRRNGNGVYETKKPVNHNKKTGNIKISSNRVQTTVYDCIDKPRIANARIENRIVNIRTVENIEKRIKQELKKYIKELHKLEELVPIVEDYYISFLNQEYKESEGLYFRTFTEFIAWADREQYILTERILKEVLKVSGITISLKIFLNKFRAKRKNTLNFSNKTELKKMIMLIKKELKKMV